MKKLFYLAFSLILIVAILTVTATAATTINLIPADDAKWTKNEAEGVSPVLTFDGGKLHVTSTGSWPSIQYTLATPLKLDPATATVNLKLTLASGGTSIRLLSNDGEQIILNHFLQGAEFDSAGDLAKAGTYELSIPLKDLKCDAGTAENQYLGTKDLVLKDGKFEVVSIMIYCVAADVTVEKLEVVGEGLEPTTGDTGVAIPLMLALASIAGAGVFVAKKSR